MKPDPLTRAAIRHGSDKYGGHLYTPIYHKLFSALREEPLKLLEIGVGGYASNRAGGLSLRMWADYFPFATIVGLDIEPKRLDVPPRVKLVQGSQIDEAVLHALVADFGAFDIVIDDGSHVVSHMIDSFLTLYPLMASEGIYAIEDTQTSFMPAFGGRTDGEGTIFELAHKVSLAMHKLEGFAPPNQDAHLDRIASITSSVSIHRNIVVFQRGSNSYPSNSRLDFTNPEVQAVFDQITAQDGADPSPCGVLSRVNMLIWAGKLREAETLAIEAAFKFPRELSLLFELKRMMEWAGLKYPCRQISTLIEKMLRTNEPRQRGVGAQIRRLARVYRSD